MGLFDIFRGGRSGSGRGKLAQRLTDHVLDRLTDDRGIRVEDAISGSATIVAERVIDYVGDFPLRDHEMPPGGRVFSTRANEILCGDASDGGWDAVPAETVFGKIRQRLDSSRFPIDSYPPLGEIFSGYAARIGEESDWGKVPLSVSEDHHPFILPIQWGFETRAFVDQILKKLNSDKEACLDVAIDSLVSIMNLVSESADPSLVLTIALETVNGMTKTAPMTEAAVEKARNEED